jgi:hypothetical protein
MAAALWVVVRGGSLSNVVMPAVCATALRRGAPHPGLSAAAKAVTSSGDVWPQASAATLTADYEFEVISDASIAQAGRFVDVAIADYHTAVEQMRKG